MTNQAFETQLWDFIMGHSDTVTLVKDDLEVPLPDICRTDAVLLCLICGKATTDFKVCDSCQSWNGGDGDSD